MIGSGPHQPRFAIISWRASTQPPVFIGSPCGHTVPGRDSSDSELFVWPTWLMILKNMGSENSLWNLISIAYFFHYFWFWGNAWTRWRSLCLFALLELRVCLKQRLQQWESCRGGQYARSEATWCCGFFPVHCRVPSTSTLGRNFFLVLNTVKSNRAIDSFLYDRQCEFCNKAAFWFYSN